MILMRFGSNLGWRGKKNSLSKTEKFGKIWNFEWFHWKQMGDILQIILGWCVEMVSEIALKLSLFRVNAFEFISPFFFIIFWLVEEFEITNLFLNLLLVRKNLVQQQDLVNCCKHPLWCIFSITVTQYND